MPLDPHRLLVLRAVHRTGSVAAAAAALHLTPSGVSQHLTRLEAQTHLPLVDRTRRGGGRPVGLTAAGTALAQRADEVALALAEAEREADRLRSGTTETVRIGGFAAALGALVVPVLARLAVTDPALRVQVLEVGQAEGVPMLRAGELDLLLGERYTSASTVAPRPYPGQVEEDLRRDPFQIVVPERRAPVEDLTELLAGPWVCAAPSMPSRHMLDHLCRRHGVAPSTRHVCTESQTVLALVAAGLGAAIVPSVTLSFVGTSGIAVVSTDSEIGARVLTLTGPARAHGPSSTERVRGALREVAGAFGM